MEFEPLDFLLGLDLTKAFSILLQDETVELRVCRIDEAIYVDANELGINIIANGVGVVDVVQLMSLGYKGASKCVMQLPFGLQFTQSQSFVRSLLGAPFQTRASEEVQPWDAFLVGDYRFHFTYNESDSSINMITISHRSVA